MATKDKRNCTITTYVTSDYRNKFKDICNERGWTISTAVKRLIDQFVVEASNNDA